MARIRKQERAFMDAGGYWWLVGLGAVGVLSYALWRWTGGRAPRMRDDAALTGWTTGCFSCASRRIR